VCETLPMQIEDIQSSADLLSIALVTAGDRSLYFTDCADEMKQCGNTPAAASFKALAASEQGRQQMVSDWAEAEGLVLAAGASPLDWQDPNVRGTYDVAAVDPIRSTPYKVLAMFAHRADTDFRFYSYVAAYTGDAAICEYAEILAEEELERASGARAQRRAAWHEERAQHPARPELRPNGVSSLADLFCVASSLERRVNTGVNALLNDYPAVTSVAASCAAVVGEIQALADSAGSCSEVAAAEAAAVDTLFETHGQADGLGPLLQLYSDMDRCFVYYDALVDCTEDEAIMLQAQQFAFSAMARIDLLHEAVLE
jgi:hypothetical protein